jgi:outer membrane biogenesis lipoprotein LolB
LWTGRVKVKEREIEVLQEQVWALEGYLFVNQCQYYKGYQQSSAKFKWQQKDKEQHQLEIKRMASSVNEWKFPTLSSNLYLMVMHLVDEI